MKIMRDTHIRNLDLNLLLPLEALLTERHITRAAKRCFLSQPAMSRALERLRVMFADPLLVRRGRSYERTVRGEHVLQELQSLIPRLAGMVHGGTFDPAQTHEKFRIALTDNASMILLPELLKHVRSAAPNVRVDISAWNDRCYDDVAAGRLDFALSAEAVPAFLETEVLFTLDFVCLVGSLQAIGTRRLTLRRYLELPHVVVATWEGQQTLVDRQLAQRGAKRHVVVSMPFFVPAAFAIAHTDLILTVPRRLAAMTASIAGVRMVEAPREIESFPYFIAWHARVANERAHMWVRKALRSAAGGGGARDSHADGRVPD
jgi:DNA-binding transcriptional LysR family regulator